MIGTRLKLFSSRVSRISATRPSIMSDGATMSAPALAWDRAVRAIRSREASLSMHSPSTQPQCPWSVYWQRQTSVMTASSGTASLTARVARCTIPSFA